MMDDLQQAYSAYQQALYHLRDPKVSCRNIVYRTKLISRPGAQALVRNWDTI